MPLSRKSRAGFPAIVVAVSLGATQTAGYGRADICWLSTDSGLIWAFIGPASVVILVSYSSHGPRPGLVPLFLVCFFFVFSLVFSVSDLFSLFLWLRFV